MVVGFGVRDLGCFGFREGFLQGLSLGFGIGALGAGVFLLSIVYRLRVHCEF